MQPIRQISGALAVVGLLLAADPSAVHAEGTKLRIVATYISSIPGMAALQVADQRGYFKQAGLDLTFASANGGGDTLRPLTTGDADIAIGSPAASTLAAMKNPEVKIAALWLPYNIFYFLGTKPIDPLNGAIIGGGVGASTSNLLIDGLADKMGVKFDIQKAGTGSQSDNWDAVKAGHLAASWAMEPYVTQMQETEGAKIVIDPAKYLPDFPADFVVVNAAYAAAHPDAMKGFFAAIERIFAEFPDRTKQAALAKDLAGVMVFPEPVIFKYLHDETTERLSRTYSLKLTATPLATVNAVLQKAKLVRADVDWGKYFDQSYLPAADQLPDLK